MGLPLTSTDVGGGFTRIGNLTYGKRGGRVLQGDLLVPAVGATRAGVLIVVHGGGWRDCARRRGAVTWFADAAARAFSISTFNVDYRLLTEGGAYPQNLMDLKCAVQFIAAHAADYGLDGSRIGIAGESAGGHLAALLAVTAARADLDPACGAAPPSVAISLSYSGPQDLPAWPEETTLPVAPVLESLTGSSCKTAIEPGTCDTSRSCDRCVDASPLAHACAASGRTVLISASPAYDSGVFRVQSERMFTALKLAGRATNALFPSDAEIAAAGCPAGTTAHGFTSPCLHLATIEQVRPLIQGALGP